MTSIVILHVSFRPERFAAALRTLEGSFVFVDPHVHLEILTFAEGLRTALDRALQRLRAQMHLDVIS